jgi:Flp pilus assembly protein TadB
MVRMVELNCMALKVVVVVVVIVVLVVVEVVVGIVVVAVVVVVVVVGVVVAVVVVAASRSARRADRSMRSADTAELSSERNTTSLSATVTLPSMNCRAPFSSSPTNAGPTWAGARAGPMASSAKATAHIVVYS